MWGDKADIDKLKKAEKQDWLDFPPIDPKKAKKQEKERAKAGRAAEKAADAEARKLARWSQTPTVRPTKQPPANKRPTVAALAVLIAGLCRAAADTKDVEPDAGEYK